MKNKISLHIKKVISIGLLFLLVILANGIMNEDTIIETLSFDRPVHGYQYVAGEEELVAQDKKNNLPVPFVEKDFVGFKEALAFKESRGKYNLVNTFGYLGKYQFGKSTLKGLRIKTTPNEFLKNPELQEKAFTAYVERNKWILRKEIKEFSGKRINGITITESGILAAAHLGGAGAVQKFLWSYGKNSMVDAYGTRIEHYLKKFSGYDLSDIQAKKRPEISIN